MLNNCTMHEVLDHLDIIEYFEVPGQQLQIGETTKRHMDPTPDWVSRRLPRYNSAGI
jgi:hypothetical protein